MGHIQPVSQRPWTDVSLGVLADPFHSRRSPISFQMCTSPHFGGGKKLKPNKKTPHWSASCLYPEEMWRTACFSTALDLLWLLPATLFLSKLCSFCLVFRHLVWKAQISLMTASSLDLPSSASAKPQPQRRWPKEFPHLHISVASVGLSPLLPKNPATHLPARSFRIVSFCSSCAISPPFPHREREVGSPVASTLFKSSVSQCPASVPIFRHMRSGPCSSRPGGRAIGSFLPYSQAGPGGK